MAYFETFASVYDSFTEDVEYEKRAGYILSLLKNGGITEGILLDTACGTGTLTEYLYKSGFDIIASDISPEMLSAAREKLSGSCGDILFLCQDMRELDLYGTIDCAVCSLDSINHLTQTEDVSAAFSRISLFMNPGGLFIFDVNTLYKHRNILSGSTFVFENDSAFLVWRNSECSENGTVDIMLDIFTENGSGGYDRDCEDFSERAYDVSVLRGLLEKAGFSVLHVYGDLSFEAPSEEEERLYFVAKKL